MNGGQNQPGYLFTSKIPLIFSDLLKLGVVETISQDNDLYCSHHRALDLFNDALLANSCQSVAYQCDNYSDFQKVNSSSKRLNLYKIIVWLFGIRANVRVVAVEI